MCTKLNGSSETLMEKKTKIWQIKRKHKNISPQDKEKDKKLIITRVTVFLSYDIEYKNNRVLVHNA